MERPDQGWWIERYEKLERPLYNVVYRWVWDPAESQDIVQEAFLRCWRMRERIEPAGLEALLFRIALRLASNHRRRRKLWRMVGFGDGAETPEAAFAEAGAADHDDAAIGFVGRQLREALDELPEAFRRVLLLSELAGMSYREIAAVMSVREGTVGSRRNRALAALRTSLLARGIDLNED